MTVHDGMLDEIIKTKEEMHKILQDVANKKYDGSLPEYVRQLCKNTNFLYIINGQPMELFNTYEKKIKDIAIMLYNPEFSKKQNVINVLEYIRIMAMYENVKEKTEEDKDNIARLSQYPLFLALLGKGVCSAQAKYTRDILVHMGIGAGDFRIRVYYNDRNYIITPYNHQETIVELGEGENYYIDPTNYKGTLDGIQFKVQPQNKKRIEENGLRTDFIATQKEIKKSRDFVFPKLIKLLGIDEISKQLKLEDMEDLQKQCTIMAFVESRINMPKNLDVAVYSANINGFNIEVGKIIELFLYENNIEYNLECDEDKRNTIYKTKMGKSEINLCPVCTYTTDKGGEHVSISMQGTHFFKRDGKNILLRSLNNKMKTTYDYFVNQGRAYALHLNVKKICEANDMDINTFVQAPMQNMKKYEPEVNVIPEVMESLVEHIKSKRLKEQNSKLTAQYITQGVAKISTRSGMDNAMRRLLENTMEKNERIEPKLKYEGENR